MNEKYFILKHFNYDIKTTTMEEDLEGWYDQLATVVHVNMVDRTNWENDEVALAFLENALTMTDQFDKNLMLEIVSSLTMHCNNDLQKWKFKKPSKKIKSYSRRMK